MIIYLSIIESEEDKSKFEQLYITYRQTMFYVANRILRMNIYQKMLFTKHF